MGLFDVDPMTDLGVYTYSDVFDSKIQEFYREIIDENNVVHTVKDYETRINYLARKKKFHEDYLIKPYSPGIHKVDKKNSEIKYIDVFSNAYTNYQKEKHYKNNGKIYDDKCFYDPIVTLVDTNNNYYTYNIADKLKENIRIKLIIVQISHIPFKENLVQKQSTGWAPWFFTHMYVKSLFYSHDYYNYLNFYIYSWMQFFTVWQIHSKPQFSFREYSFKQLPFNVYIQYGEDPTIKPQRLTFFNSVFYLPAYLKNDKNYKIVKLKH